MALSRYVSPYLFRSFIRTLCSNKIPSEIIKHKQAELEKQNEGALEKALRIAKDDFKRLRRGQLKPDDEKVPKHVDYLVIGGGIMGSAIAYSMKNRAPDSFDLMVVERDPKYTRASTTLSVGGIRQQFSLPENIQLSLYSSEFLRKIKQHLSVLDDDPPDIDFQPHGYLMLATENGVEQMRRNYEIQKECGAKVVLFTPDELSKRFPWINTDGIALGSYGVENEGWFDPWSLLSAFKKKSISLGAKYVEGELIGFDFHKHPQSTLGSPDEPNVSTHHAYIKDDVGEIHTVEFHIMVVAAGAYSGEVARLLSIGNGPGLLQVPMTVEPRKRYVYTFHCAKGPGLDMPLVVDPSGAYVRREGLGGMYICGRSPTASEEPDVSNLDVDYNYFDQSVWPQIAKRIPDFECIKVSSAWAGYYDYNKFDQNAFFGFHPFYSNVFFATGFSGHGIQMAPAIGRATAEVLLDKEFRTIDLSRFGLHRLYNEKPLREDGIV